MERLSIKNRRKKIQKRFYFKLLFCSRYSRNDEICRILNETIYSGVWFNLPVTRCRLSRYLNEIPFGVLFALTQDTKKMISFISIFLISFDNAIFHLIIYQWLWRHSTDKEKNTFYEIEMIVHECDLASQFRFFSIFDFKFGYIMWRPESESVKVSTK